MEFYSKHNRLTPELWHDYSVNAYRTTPDVGKLLTQWGVIQPGQDPAMVVWDLANVRRVEDLKHGAHGLATELYEYACAPDEENRNEELGDICWYLAVIVRGLDLCLDDICPPTDDGTMFAMTFPACAHEVVGDLKRLAYYDRQEIRDRLITNIRSTLICIQGLASCSMAELLDQNSHKLLKKRYPDGFSNEAATARRDKPGESD
jgi:hypothetical protein